MDSYKSKVARLYCADALEMLAKQDPKSIDLFISDPPYPALEKHRARGTTTRLSKSKGSKMPWFGAMTNEQLEESLALTARVLKPGGHGYMMANSEQMWDTRPMIDRVGLKFHKAVIWNKVAIGMGYHYRSQYEAVLFFSKPGPYKALRNLGTPDFITFDVTGTLDTATIKRLKDPPRKSEKQKPIVWPTEKPVSLMELLVAQSSKPGDLVLDPFTGAGAATAVATVKLNRRFLGYEIHGPYFKEAVRRIEAAECEYDRTEEEAEEDAA